MCSPLHCLEWHSVPLVQSIKVNDRVCGEGRRETTFPGVREHKTVVTVDKSGPSSSSSSSSEADRDSKESLTTLLPFESAISSPKETLVICTAAGVINFFASPPVRTRCLRISLKNEPQYIYASKGTIYQERSTSLRKTRNMSWN